MIATPGINFQTELAHFGCDFATENSTAFLHVDVEIVLGIAFCRRRKNRLRQLRREFQSCGQFFSANALRLLILFPAGAGQITAHYAFHRQRFSLANDHGATGELFAKTLQRFREFVEIRCDEVVLDLVKAFEPKRRELIEDGAFFRYRVGQDHIERGKPISHDKEQSLAEIENFADLSAAQFLDSRKID